MSTTSKKYRVARCYTPGIFSPTADPGMGLEVAATKLLDERPLRSGLYGPPAMPISILIGDDYHNLFAELGPFALGYKGTTYVPVAPEEVSKDPGVCTLRVWPRQHEASVMIHSLLEVADHRRSRELLKLSREDQSPGAKQAGDAAAVLNAGSSARLEKLLEEPPPVRLSHHPDPREAVFEALDLEHAPPVVGCWEGLVGVFTPLDDSHPGWIVFNSQVFELSGGRAIDAES